MDVVNLAHCREMLTLLDTLRSKVLSGQVDGLGLCVKAPDGTETIVYAGTCTADPQCVARVAMRISWELTMQADAAAHESVAVRAA